MKSLQQHGGVEGSRPRAALGGPPTPPTSPIPRAPGVTGADAQSPGWGAARKAGRPEVGAGGREPQVCPNKAVEKGRRRTDLSTSQDSVVLMKTELGSGT